MYIYIYIYPLVHINTLKFWPFNKLCPFWTHLLNLKTSGISSEAAANREILFSRPLMKNFSLLHISIFHFSGSDGFNVCSFGDNAEEVLLKMPPVTDNINPRRCTRARRTRIIKAPQIVHASHAPAPASQQLQLGRWFAQTAAAGRPAPARATHARSERPQ